MIFSKLDRFLVSEEFLSKWPGASVMTLDRKFSGHSPICLKVTEVDFGPKPFRFFNVWAESKDFVDIVKDAWNTQTLSMEPDKILRDKLKNVKIALRAWSKNKFGMIDEVLSKCVAGSNKWEMEAEKRTLTESEILDWKSFMINWMEKELVKKKMLQQRATLKWVAEGDDNS